MTKSISRSQVRLIASTNAIFGAEEACAMLRISRDAMYRLAKDPDDPFPIRYIGGKTRDGIVLHDCGRGGEIAGTKVSSRWGSGRGERPSTCRLSLACPSRCAMLRASIPAWLQPSGRVWTHQSSTDARLEFPCSP